MDNEKDCKKLFNHSVRDSIAMFHVRAIQKFIENSIL
jgi:N-acetylmuramoyl-L-alanine amidase